MNIEIKKMDNFGRGIGYIDDKVVFVPKSIIGDILEIEITLSKKNYDVAKIKKIIKPSKSRIETHCPYFQNCGGCMLSNMEYRLELQYKLDKVNNIFAKNHLDYEIKEIVKSKKRINYRNKVSLKIENGEIGFYEANTHKLIKIDKCLLLKESINDFINDINQLKIKNGIIIIRSNYKDELLIIIYTKEDINNYKILIDNYKIAGIIVNDKTIYGSDFFVDKIGTYLFKVSYNSFFQVNPFICEELFKYIKSNVKGDNLLDLYSGVGTLSIVAKSNVQNILGVEIVANAVLNAKANAVINNINNISFIESDTDKVTKYIKDKDIVLLDPPRSGLTKNIIDAIIKYKVLNIVYISCDSATFTRDLLLLSKDYIIKEVKLFDMFPSTYHVECVCMLKLR